MEGLFAYFPSLVIVIVLEVVILAVLDFHGVWLVGNVDHGVERVELNQGEDEFQSVFAIGAEAFVDENFSKLNDDLGWVDVVLDDLDIDVGDSAAESFEKREDLLSNIQIDITEHFHDLVEGGQVFC